MPIKTKKITLDELEKAHPDRFRSARKTIEIAESFPVKGGNVIQKKSGGWFESLRNSGSKAGDNKPASNANNT